MKGYPIGKNTVIFVAKPDAVRRGLVEIIRQEIKQAGFYILAEKEKCLTTEEIKYLYQNSFRRDYPDGEDDVRAEKHIEFIRSAPVRAYLVEHKHTNKPQLFETTKKVKGDHWLAAQCNQDSIRFKLRNVCFDDYTPHFEDGFLVTPVPENVVHATLSEDELQRAFMIFFKDLIRKGKYNRKLPELTFPDGRPDLLLVVTYNNSSSDRMKVKMHNGVSHLFSFLEQRGHSVKLKGFADMKPKDIAHEVARSNSRVVGFSTVSSEFSQVAEISNYLCGLIPDTIFVGGGAHFTINPQDIYSTSLDFVVVGESEYTLDDVLKGKPIRLIPGVAYRGSKGLQINPTRPFLENISCLPPAEHKAWDVYPKQRDYPHRRIVISRGCPYNCSYCSNRTISKVSRGKYTRFRSPENIEEEIKIIVGRYPHVKTVFLESECLIPGLADVKGILEMTRKYKDKFEFGTNIRIGSFKSEFLQHLREGGFTFANLGLESGSERIRTEILNRNYTNDQVKDMFKVAREEGLRLNTYNLIGLPTETLEEFQETINLNLLIKPADAQVAIFQPYPGTPLYYRCLEMGLLDNPFYHHFFEGKERRTTVLKMDQFPQEEILGMYDKFRSIFG